MSHALLYFLKDGGVNYGRVDSPDAAPPSSLTLATGRPYDERVKWDHFQNGAF